MNESAPSLKVFRQEYSKNDNLWWKIEYGDHKNLFDEACERIDELDKKLSKAVELINELRGYCKDAWDWKYGKRWDAETEEIIKTEIPDEPPRPTEDEMMRVAPGWEVERYDRVGVGEYYLIDERVYHAIFTPSEKAWVVRKRPDWAYYQRENAEKWLEENRPELKIVGLSNYIEPGILFIAKGDEIIFHSILSFINTNHECWRWVVEPNESVNELPISYKHRVAACVMIDGNPMTLQKVACYYWERFVGFLYADGSIEADFKRMRNGQVEWATKVRVKE